MNLKPFTILFLAGIVLLTGCAQVATNSVDQLSSPTPASTTLAPTFRAVRTSHPTSTQLPTQTMTPKVMPESVPSSTPFIPSPSPLPTLSDPESADLVDQLLHSNAGCLYPCWWGIIPGKTIWPEANHFLASFVEITPFVAENSSTGEPTYLIRYPLQNERGKGGYNVYVRNDQITIIFVGKDSTEQNSLLHQILTKYGAPENVYLSTLDAVPGDDYPLTLVLSCASKHFILSYRLIAHAENDELISCPHGESPGLWLWAPDEIVNEQRIQDWTLGGDPIIPLKPLEQVTDLDIESFTEIFSAMPSESTCLTTNKEFWKVER